MIYSRNGIVYSAAYLRENSQKERSLPPRGSAPYPHHGHSENLELQQSDNLWAGETTRLGNLAQVK